ncbi:MAG: DUF1127 domain-containing protein [Kiloniellales bacterium]
MSRLTERELELIRRERLAAERETGHRSDAGFLTAQVIDPILRALRRRRTIAQLSRLDDRMLQDIGLTRGSLETVADAMVSIDSARSQAAAARREHGLLAALRRWRRRQATIQQLASLDDRVLSDIGVVRGDIASIVDRALDAEEAVPASVAKLLRGQRTNAPRAQRPFAGYSLSAKAMAEQALQIAGQRQAS